MKKNLLIKNILNGLFVILTIVSFVVLMQTAHQAEEMYKAFVTGLPEWTTFMINFYSVFYHNSWLTVLVVIITSAITFGTLFLISRKLKLVWSIVLYVVLFVAVLPLFFLLQYGSILYPLYTLSQNLIR